MEPHAAVAIAAKMTEATGKLDEAIEYMLENLDPGEQAPLIGAIGEVFGIMTTEIKSRLVIANPELHDVLFHGFPRQAARDFLRMSQHRSSTDRRG